MTQVTKNQDGIMSAEQRLEKNKELTMLIYVLYGISIFFVIPYFIAIIINYIKREEVKDSFLESHFDWQIHTFWYSLLWSILGLITLLVGIGVVILIIDAIWFIYRIVKGVLYLNDGKRIRPTEANLWFFVVGFIICILILGGWWLVSSVF